MAKNIAKKKLNLSTAKTADGALQAPRTVYELIGKPITHYREKTLEEYSKMLGSLDLSELHQIAYKEGVLAGPDRHNLIGRLESRYVSVMAKAYGPRSQPADPSLGGDPAIRAEAERIVARGR